jgi:acetyl esterase/lipase
MTFARLVCATGNCLLSIAILAGAALHDEPLQDPPRPPLPGQEQTPPLPQRPNIPQRPQQPGRPGDQPPFRLPPGVDMVQDVVYAVVDGSATSDDLEGAEEDDAGGNLKPPSPPAPPPEGDGNEQAAPDQSEEGHALLLNAFFPRESGDDPLPAIIYIHGGGFTGGSRDIGNQYSALLALGGYFTVTIDYRLLGDAPFPAAIHDCKAAVRFLRANAEELGIDPARIGVWGHSAGGHLSAFLGTAGNAAETHGDIGEFDHADSNVNCVVDFFGPSDFTVLPQTSRVNEGPSGRGGGPGEIRLFGEQSKDWSAEERATRLLDVSPIHWVDAHDPPFLIIHGTEDRVVPISQSDALHEALVAAGTASELVRVEGAGHGIREPGVLLQAAKFFDQHLGGSAAPVFERLQQAQQQMQQDRPIDR